MSRKERKKTEKRYKRFFRLCIFMQIILLIGALFLVDLRIRSVLEIDEISLVSYKNVKGNIYDIHIMGRSHLIDLSRARTQVSDRFALLQEMIYNIKQWTKGIL